jgi:hypothetical protein
MFASERNAYALYIQVHKDVQVQERLRQWQARPRMRTKQFVRRCAAAHENCFGGYAIAPSTNSSQSSLAF